ncbi:hypothetical protein C5167_007440 [Papaver somniferum]|nr:hypothetical protein C5167_007440 [Papaver somniferum]
MDNVDESVLDLKVNLGKYQRKDEGTTGNDDSIPCSDCGKHSSVDIAGGKVCIWSNMSAENSLRNVGIKSTLNQGYARYCSLLTVMWMIITLTGNVCDLILGHKANTTSISPQLGLT